MTVLSAEAQRSESVISGFKLGVNASSLDSNANFAAFDDTRIGFHAGFFLEIPINKTLSFQPEIQYSAQGAKDENARLNYINVPLLLKINLAQSFSLHLGGQGSVKIWEFEQRETYNNFGYGAVGGIGINLSSALFVEGRYVYGLSNVLDDNNTLDITEDVKNSYIQVSLGIRL